MMNTIALKISVLGEEGFGEEIAREGGANEERKSRKSIETAFQEIAWQLETTPDALRGKDRRWEISKKRSGGLAGPGAGVPGQ